MPLTVLLDKWGFVLRSEEFGTAVWRLGVRAPAGMRLMLLGGSASWRMKMSFTTNKMKQQGRL